MDAWIERLAAWASVEQLLSGVRALVLLAAGFLVARVASRGLSRLLGERLEMQQAVLLQRATHSVLLVLFAVAALHELGFQLGVLLGAAGILSVALGFASQTSASNVISGLFLIFERPFRIGDLIQIGDTVGEVLSVDLLSVKLRTFDNRYVRVPNESVIKSQVTTLTRFPIRRVDLTIGVAYKEDVARVKEVLLQVAEKNPLCLAEPEPVIVHQGFGESSVNLLFGPWVRREHFLELRNSIQEEIQAAFDAEGIEIPFPHRTLYAGSATAPLPVRLVDGDS